MPQAARARRRARLHQRLGLGGNVGPGVTEIGDHQAVGGRGVRHGAALLSRGFPCVQFGHRGEAGGDQAEAFFRRNDDNTVLYGDLHVAGNLTADGEEALREFVLLGDGHIEPAPEAELDALRVAVEHRFLCGRGERQSGERRNIGAETVAAGEAVVVLDHAGAGRGRVGDDGVDREEFVRAADGSERLEVGLVQEQNGLAVDAPRRRHKQAMMFDRRF